MPGMTTPWGWQLLARDAVARCDQLVGEVVQAPPTVAVVRLLDEISDTLCQVLDAAEFCRNVHADAEWRRQAQQVCMEMGAYVQQLNVHFGLYSALARALREQQAAAAAAVGPAAAAAAAAQGWTPEAVLVGRMLQRDFERYGVHLQGEAQDRMNSLMERSQELGMRFTHSVVDPATLGTLQLTGGMAEAAQRLPLALRRRLQPLSNFSSGAVTGLAVSGDTPTLHSLLRNAADEGLRRAAWEACHQTPTSNLAVLDALVEARHDMAQLMGFPSYAEYQLDSFSLAGRPTAVGIFLERLADAIAPKAAAEASELGALKHRLLGGGGLQPWDKQYLVAAAEAGAGGSSSSSSGELGRHPAPQPTFRLEAVVEGLSELLRRSMGVSLQERPLGRGEGWASGVRKMEAVHETEGVLGTVYLDLVRRPHKFPSAAHFTLRCSRRLADGSYQMPVVALVANWGEHSELGLSEVETLFHEFGHALNSLLSRTEFQHLAGTRGPTDMVEVPSHTLELFASDPRVLSLIGSGAQGAARALSPEALQRAERARRRRFAALDQQQQLQFCLIDQLLHGPEPPTGQRAQREIAALMEQHSALPHAPGCHPHIRFSHIVGYGATYYSYLFAQCLSARIWQDHLVGDPTSRAAGELLRHRLLEPGGAKEAHCMVEDLLASPPSSSGSSGSTNTGSGSPSSSSGGGLCHAGGGYFPDPAAMLEQQGLLL
ncbi:putative mitochondrial intermediate mitochondrial [Chlorella sorokiniana]|uniref:Mitochondrial intermediate mitochondrial n=1 Tax=Chlorella sorokiniana TaxID=3076 RepID=A0A2P6TEZ3_CHLSO|nr:putative mitochondrial intermediate mitochondrial [Chlorella sorokiniana]|eukprot:PRW32540.1 putative mitochondrial intermediate mitochondrial [Chlorella sorokiniana]